MRPFLLCSSASVYLESSDQRAKGNLHLSALQLTEVGLLPDLPAAVPIAVLKTDRSLIDHLVTDERDRRCVAGRPP